MKSFLRSLRPNSLFGQLLLVMLIGTAVLQGVNFYAVYSIQRSYSGEFLSIGHDYAASIYQAARRMNATQRKEYMDDVARSRNTIGKPFRFRILNRQPDWETEDYYKSVGMRDALKNAMAASGINPPDIRARLLYETSPEAADPDYRDHLFPLLQVMIQLDDGDWLEFTQPMILTDFSLIRRQRTLILLASLVIAVAATLLTRRATRPLSKLGQAAEVFGSNPEMAQPIEEGGSIEVREAAQSFNRMRKRICENLNERNSMLEAMGHDLRTPLARIQLRLDKIQPDGLREKFAANIDEIQSIIEQGLELARSLHTSEKAVPLDIGAFLESMADDMNSHKEIVSLGDHPGENGPTVLVSARPVCLKRSIENLLSNAVAYAGEARISVTEQDGNVVIDIDDDGPGIPGERLEKVFEPYYRLEGSRNRESGGTGLGLSIARNMVLLNNGALDLRNRPEGGLTARVRLSPEVNFG